MKKTNDGSAFFGYSAIKIKFHKKPAYFIYMDPTDYALLSGSKEAKGVAVPRQSQEVAIFSAGNESTWAPISILPSPLTIGKKVDLGEVGVLGFKALDIRVVQRFNGPRKINSSQKGHFARHADGVPCIIVK